MKKTVKKKIASAVVLSFTATCFIPQAAFASAAVPTTQEDVVKYSSDAMLTSQQQVEGRILQEYQAGSYTIDEPLIKVDPYGVSPLSALVLFKTDKECTVRIDVLGRTPEATISHEFNDYRIDHQIPVYGLYEDDTTRVQLTLTDRSGKSSSHVILIKTGALPDNGLIDFNPQWTTLNESQMIDGLTFTVRPDGNDYANMTAYDTNGDLRCVLTNVGFVTPIRRLADGQILMHSRKTQRCYFQMSFYEMDPLGKVYTEVLRNGVHHETVKLSNGNYLVDSEVPNRHTTEDFIVELDGQTGEKVREWDLTKIMDMKNYVANPHYDYNDSDWAHVNSFWPVPGEDAIIFSPRHQDGVYKLNLATSEIEWAITEPDEDFGPDLAGKLLTPVSDNFEYCYGQHAVSMLPDGRIFVFDNGDGRSKDPDKQMKNEDTNNYSRGVIYEVNEKDKTVRQIWQYGKERGSELYSMFICDVDYLGPNHYLINFGGILDYASGKSWTENIGTTKIVEIKNDRVISELKLDTNTYRVERMNPYDIAEGEYNLTKNPGKQIGKLVVNEEFLTK